MNERSAKYEKVRGYYIAGLWTKAMVKNAVGRWINEEESAEIIGSLTAEGDIRAADTFPE